MRPRKKRGSAILYVLFMVLSISIVIVLAAELGMGEARSEKRYERDSLVARAWDAALSQVDADEVAGKITSFPSTRAFSLNGVSGTVTIVDNSVSMANSLLVTSTLTAPDGSTYAETGLVSKIGNFLNGSYWWTNGSSIVSVGTADAWMIANPTATGTFQALLLNYNNGNNGDTYPIKSWLSTDSSQYSGANNNFEDGVLKFRGTLTIPANNTVLQLGSDDGADLSVNADQYNLTQDGVHAYTTSTITIPNKGTYPISVTYYNHQYKAGNNGVAQFSLLWNTTGGTTYTSIPSANLGTFAQSWTLNGSAVSYGDGVQLVNTVAQTGSAWLNGTYNVNSFHAAFNFRILNPVADGFTFCLQRVGPSAIGLSGANLGFGGIASSAAVKFDLFNNSGEGTDSTGLFTNGAIPTVPSVDMTASGVKLNSGDMFHCALSYSGTTLSETLTDETTGSIFSTTYTVNLGSVLGNTKGVYVGFTGGTGASSCTVQITSFDFGS